MLSSLPGWRAGEQILELHFVPGTVTGWLIDAGNDVRRRALNVHVET